MNKQPKKHTLKRLLKMLIKSYPVLVPLTVLCIIFSAVTASVPAFFIQNIIESIGKWVQTGDWNAASKEILPMVDRKSVV